MARFVLLLSRFFISFLFCFFAIFPSSNASPLRLTPFNVLEPRDIIIRNITGNPEVINTNTNQLVPQSLGTDGSGKGFDAPALIWLGFCFLVGIPMALAGIWGLKRKIAVTRGVVSGLTFAVGSWSALTNTLSSVPPLSDFLFTVSTLGFFALGFVLGLPNFTKHLVTVSLGIMGGLAFGVRVVLLRSGLLFGGVAAGDYAANWILAGAMGLIGGALIFWSKVKRLGLACGCASIGTFLTLLGVDLILNKQAGMSAGLRFLFDRNSAHLIDIMQRGYQPPLSTLIILGISLGLTPILGYLQYRLFPPPPPAPLDFENGAMQDENTALRPPQATLTDTVRKSIFADLWDGARKGKSPNRFSV